MTLKTTSSFLYSQKMHELQIRAFNAEKRGKIDHGNSLHLLRLFYTEAVATYKGVI